MFKKFTSEDVSGQNQVKASVQRKIRQSITEEYPLLEPVMDDLLPKKSPLIVAKCQNHLNLVVVNNVPLFFNVRDGPYMPTLRLLHQFPNRLYTNDILRRQMPYKQLCPVICVIYKHDPLEVSFLVLVWASAMELEFQDPNIMKALQVDRGAIKFVLAGANIMCPGLTSPGGFLDDEVTEETPVAIMAEGKQHALAIGFTKMSAKDMLPLDPEYFYRGSNGSEAELASPTIHDIRAINKGIGVDNMHYLNDGLWKMEKLD